ncbi:MAG: hypothetical protein J6S32_02870 [Clostridia bacterium]|nr:hypothetical protein [Clostridia bacterium]
MSKRIISIVAIVALVAVLGVCLVACGKNADTYADRLEKAGYTVVVATEEELAEIASQDAGIELEIKWGVSGEKGTDMVSVICFANKDQAEAYATIVNAFGALMGGIKAETDGAILFMGTEQAIKDAK